MAKAKLEDSSLRKTIEEPKDELNHLQKKGGYGGIRGGTKKGFTDLIEILVESLLEQPEAWPQWALRNIPNLRDWEKERLLLLIKG